MKLTLKEKEILKNGVVQLNKSFEKYQACVTREDVKKVSDGLPKNAKWLEGFSNLIDECGVG